MIRALIAVAERDVHAERALAEHGDRAVRDYLRENGQRGVADHVARNAHLDPDEIAELVDAFGRTAERAGADAALDEVLVHFRCEGLVEAILDRCSEWTRRRSLAFDRVVARSEWFSARFAASLLDECLSGRGGSPADRRRVAAWFERAGAALGEDRAAGVDVLGDATIAELGSMAPAALVTLVESWPAVDRRRVAERVAAAGAAPSSVAALAGGAWSTPSDLFAHIAANGLTPACRAELDAVASLSVEQLFELATSSTDPFTVAALCTAADIDGVAASCVADQAAVLAELVALDPARAARQFAPVITTQRWDLISLLQLGHVDPVDTDVVFAAIDERFGAVDDRWVMFAKLGDPELHGSGVSLGDFVDNICALSAVRSVPS